MLPVYGAVYCMTNAADCNQIVAYSRNRYGLLSLMDVYDTGGAGSGTQTTDPLMSQGSMIMSADRRFLFAVNTGSGSITSFTISNTGELTRINTLPSGGVMPNSLALFEDILYVSNRGDNNSSSASNLTGFRIDCCGKPCRIPYATYLLSRPDARPSCIRYNPSGDKLIVSELSTNLLTVFSACRNGSFVNRCMNASNGPGPFGSLFLKNGVFLVAEAGSNSLSSYADMDRGQLHVISGSVPNGQKATCWVSVNQNQRVAYTSNAGSNTISIYDICQSGSLSYKKNVISNPNGNAAPLDNGVSSDGRNFYVLNGNEGSISVFEISYHGDLSLKQVFADTGLPRSGAQGLVVS